MKGKQVLITGGTGGLGSGVTPVVLAQGAEVTISYRNPKEIERFKETLPPADFERLNFIPANLEEEGSVGNLIN